MPTRFPFFIRKFKINNRKVVFPESLAPITNSFFPFLSKSSATSIHSLEGLSPLYLL